MSLLSAIQEGKAEISRTVTDANGTTTPEVPVENSDSTGISPIQILRDKAKNETIKYEASDVKLPVA